MDEAVWRLVTESNENSKQLNETLERIANTLERLLKISEMSL